MTRRLVVRVWLVMVVIAFAVALAQPQQDGTQSELGATLLLGALALLMFPPTIYWACKVGTSVGQSVGRLAQPLPTPQDIAVALEEEWGRPPTFEEVGAVHQVILSQRHNDLIGAGIGLGAIYLVDRNLHQ